jgi:hypothetical protein
MILDPDRIPNTIRIRIQESHINADLIHNSDFTYYLCLLSWTNLIFA